MARYTGADCRLCRREGAKLFLKGDRCYTEKCAIERRNYAPGEAGKKRIKESEYRNQLREKQKTKRIYGVLEKQFRHYYDMANRQKGVTARTCCVSWRAVSTTSCTVSVSRSLAPRLVSRCVTAISP